MKKIIGYIFILSVLIIPLRSYAGTPDSALVGQYFKELQNLIMQDHGQFWGLSLDGPVFCIDPLSRQLLANCQSAHSTFRPEGDLFAGNLPPGPSSANSIMDFEGENWTMVMWPLPADYHKRMEIMIHESFHRIQKYLGFRMGNPMVPYLDKKNGRIWFRLEANALYKAVQGRDAEMIRALKHALYFRYRRFKENPDPGKAEMRIETNEGLAQYTGYHVAYHNAKEKQVGYFRDLMDLLGNTPSFVRSSAYFTGAMYGELFDRLDPGWNRELSDSADFFSLGMKLTGTNTEILSDLNDKEFREEYGYAKIVGEETARQEIADKKLLEYRNKFLGKNAFTIHFTSLHIGFSPSNLVNLDDTGTVYPNCNVSDDFGILTVTNGALLFNDWKSMNIAPPQSVTDTLAQGDGWELRLNKGWRVRKNERMEYQLERN